MLWNIRMWHMWLWNNFLRKMWCGHEDAWDNFGWKPMLLMMFSNAKGLGAGLRRHFSHALVDLEVWCTISYAVTLFPHVLQLVETFGNYWNSIWNSRLFLCTSISFCVVVDGRRHSKYYNSLARLAVIVRQVCNSLVAQAWQWSGKAFKVSTRFCHILICPDNFTNASLLSPHMFHFYLFFK